MVVFKGMGDLKEMITWMISGRNIMFPILSPVSQE